MVIDFLFDPDALALIAAGSVIGYIFGIIPGLSGLTALALFAPFGLYLKPTVAFYFYASMLGAATFAGSVPAILLAIPGTPLNLVSTLDGFPLSRQGKGMEALSISAVASALGALISVAVLVLMIPLARFLVMLFGPSEKFWLIALALVAVPMLTGEDWMKGMVAATLGMVLSFVGRSIVTGEFRYTGDIFYMGSGFSLIPFLAIGFFAVSVLLQIMHEPQRAIAIGSVKLDLAQIRDGALFVLKRPISLLRNSFIGAVIGIMPGLGGVTASMIAYLVEKGVSKTPGEFGKGIREGLMAPETANNAVQGGDAIPTLFLGIPGSVEWAVIIGIMVMYGIEPGPGLLIEHPGVVWGVVIGIALSNVISSSIGLLVGVQLSRLTKIKPIYIVAVILVTCILGSYLINNNIWDCFLALVGGLLGYFIRQLKYELLPFALGFILGPLVEKNFFMTVQVGYGNYSVFYGSAVSLILIVLCVSVVAAGPWIQRRQHQLTEVLAKE